MSLRLPVNFFLSVSASVLALTITHKYQFLSLCLGHCLYLSHGHCPGHGQESLVVISPLEKKFPTLDKRLKAMAKTKAEAGTVTRNSRKPTNI